MREADEFWEELLAQIEAGQVIPVVGPELLWAAVEGREIPLYQALAERLLAKYGLVASVAKPEGDPAPNGTPVLLRPYHELNDAVCALARRGRRVQDLYRPINELLKAMLEAPAPIAFDALFCSARGSFSTRVVEGPATLVGGQQLVNRLCQVAPSSPARNPSQGPPGQRMSRRLVHGTFTCSASFDSPLPVAARASAWAIRPEASMMLWPWKVPPSSTMSDLDVMLSSMRPPRARCALPLTTMLPLNRPATLTFCARSASTWLCGAKETSPSAFI